MYYSTVSSSIKFLHNVSDIGSTNWSKQPVLVVLNGFNNPRAIPVIIKIDSLFDALETDTPTITRLSSITTQKLLNSTEAPDTHPQKFRHLPFILLPPFLWKTACDLKDRSPGSVFLALSKCIDKCIEANEDDETLNTASQRTCSSIYTFLWAALKEQVGSIRIIPAIDNTAIDQWAHSRHSQYLIPQDLPRSNDNHTHHHGFHQIAEAIELQSASILASQSDKTKKGFSKLHSATKTLILNMSSTN